MSRDIKFMYHDGERLLNLSGFFSELCDYKWNGNGSIKVQGCGMDMGFHVISSVARTLFDDYKKNEFCYLLFFLKKKFLQNLQHY